MPAGDCPGAIRSRSMSAVRSNTLEHLVEHARGAAPMTHTRLSKRSGRACRARTTGAILIASGRVPKTLSTRIIGWRQPPAAAPPCVCIVTKRKPRSTTRAKTLRSTASRTPS